MHALTASAERFAQSLGDSYRLRVATAADLATIESLIAGAIHHEAGPEVAAVLRSQDAGPGAFLVVECSGEVVAVTGLLVGTAKLGEVSLPFGQLEFVATAPDHRRRGLVRALSHVAHHASDDRGDAFQLVSGVEYLYRRLGYEYAVLAPRTHRVDDIARSASPGWSFRLATLADEDRLRELQELVAGAVDLAIRPSPNHYEWLDQVDHYSILVAERDDRIEACARAYLDDDGIALSETAASSPEAADALVVFAQRVGGEGRPVTIADRPGGGAAFLSAKTISEIGRDGYYLRIAKPVAFLEALRLVFNARLAASSLHAWTGVVEIGRYVDAVRMVVEHGVVGHIEAMDPDVVGAGASQVPPDLFATLVFGEHGAPGLEELHPDVILGDFQRPLLRTLFPPITSDFVLY